MKANEAPEKIYVNFHFVETHPGRSPLVTKQGLNKYDVIYTRTDAFIEKAKKWFENYTGWTDLKGNRHFDLEDFEDFKKYMKGE